MNAVAEELIRKITKAPRVLLVEPAVTVAMPLKNSMEREFQCDVDWKMEDNQIDFDGLKNYDIIFVDADLALLHELLDHLKQCAPYVPVVLIGGARQPFEGTVTIYQENENDLAGLDEVFGKFKLRVKRHHRPSFGG